MACTTQARGHFRRGNYYSEPVGWVFTGGGGYQCISDGEVHSGGNAIILPLAAIPGVQLGRNLRLPGELLTASSCPASKRFFPTLDACRNFVYHSRKLQGQMLPMIIGGDGYTEDGG